MADYQDYDVCGPLPGPGTTLLEASAGTGKTYTIAALLARMVADGVAPLSQVLVVTFTRMATGELRERSRERLVSAEAGLRRFLRGTRPVPAEDPVLGLLAEGPAEAVASRRHRLRDALATFDSATITTTHGFCLAVLNSLGVWGQVAPGARLLEDSSDLVEQVVDDLLVRRALRASALPFNRRTALQVAEAATGNPATALRPPANPDDATPVGLRRRFAEGARAGLDHWLADGNLLTYDGLLVRLAAALRDGERGRRACARLRERYQVVLVDEFQDTDSVQWEVVRLAFAAGGTRLVLVGDPKQAVYSFRGADVYAYLDAARLAPPAQRFTLACNWRSDGPLLQAFDALLAPLHLGHPEIVYRPAVAAPGHEGPGLSGVPVAAPLRVRMVSRQGNLVPRTSKGLLQKDAAVRFIAEDLAADVVSMLSRAPLLLRPGDGHAPPRALAAGDIGVLVRTNRQAVVVQEALRSVGVPVVVAGAQSVLASPAAREWLHLLHALDQPASRGAAAAAGLGPFVGMRASDLAGADQGQWEELHSRLHQWSALARQSGIASLFWYITASEGLPARLLQRTDGERWLTDLGHIAELLHTEAATSQLGLSALREWLARRVGEDLGEGTEADQRSRRLDSDAAAVQVLTVHRAKGLEFPVVYCPYLWDSGWRERKDEPVVFHEPETEARYLDVGGSESGDPVYTAHLQWSRAERRGEDLRHLYVAVTRAKHQAVLWWAGAHQSQHSAWGRLLLVRSATGEVQPSGRPGEPRDRDVLEELQRLSTRAPGLVSIEQCGPLRRRTGAPAPAPAPPELSAAPFDRALDDTWRRSSYTSVTVALHDGAYGVPPGDEALVASEPEHRGTTDEAVGPPADEALPGERLLAHLPSPFNGIPPGAGTGTFVHRCLEDLDFDREDLLGAALESVASVRMLPPGVSPDRLAQALQAALTTPLGPAIPGALHGVSRRDRLDELHFELPLAGGDRPTGEVPMAALGALLGAHIPPGHPLSAYPEALMDAVAATSLRGYLTGSVDLVLRRSFPAGPKYFVVDYKTNWLGGDEEELTTWHYRPEALAAAMCRSHYPLQALFYLVALHRYLRWRQPGYEPAAHLGGAVYLFLRGMAGPATPVGTAGTCGVFTWAASPQLVTEVSDLLASSARTGAR